jgi:hypothetical protein
LNDSVMAHAVATVASVRFLRHCHRGYRWWASCRPASPLAGAMQGEALPSPRTPSPPGRSPGPPRPSFSSRPQLRAFHRLASRQAQGCFMPPPSARLHRSIPMAHLPSGGLRGLLRVVRSPEVSLHAHDAPSRIASVMTSPHLGGRPRRTRAPGR